MTTKARKRINLGELAANKARIIAEGCSIDLMSAACHHYRVRSPAGQVVEFYASTLVWVRNADGKKGAGVDSMLELISAGDAVANRAPPTVTIFADASFCHKSRSGGWGAWMIRHGEPSTTAGGELKGRVKSSFLAETMAIANALHFGVARTYVRPGETVMIQSDCKAALDCILKTVPSSYSAPAPGGVDLDAVKRVRAELVPPLDLIAKMAAENRIVLALRHVKGHQDGDGRAWVNREVDRIAKLHMRRRRDTPTELRA
jgi:ribonuclease HI